MSEKTPAKTIPASQFRAIRTGAWFERVRQASEARHPLYAVVYDALLHLAWNKPTPRIIHVRKPPLIINAGQCWVTCQQIVDYTGFSESTVRRALKFWEALGVIRRKIIKSRIETTIGQLVTLVYWKEDVVQPSKKNGVGDRVSGRTPEGVTMTGHLSTTPGIGKTLPLEEDVTQDVEVHPRVLGALQEVILARNDESQDAVSVRTWFRTVVETYAWVTESVPSEPVQRGLGYLFAQYGPETTTNAIIQGMERREEWLANPDGLIEDVRTRLAREQQKVSAG